MPENTTPKTHAPGDHELTFFHSTIEGYTTLDQNQLMMKLIYMLEQLREALIITHAQKRILKTLNHQPPRDATSEIQSLCDRAQSLATLARELYIPATSQKTP